MSHTPMHYTAERAKELYPDSLILFISPCISKKSEAISSHLVDYVINIEELSILLESRGIRPEKLAPTPFLHPATERGRGFPISGGVAQALKSLIGDEISPTLINGINKQAINLLKAYIKNPGTLRENSNFVEVMSCEGGCVAGPCVTETPAQACKKIQQLLQQ